MLAQRIMWIAWPAFLVAAVMEMVVFAFVDPQDLHWFDGQPLSLSRQGIYTLSFFAFWPPGPPTGVARCWCWSGTAPISKNCRP